MLGVHVIEDIPVAYEPPVVSRMAAMLPLGAMTSDKAWFGGALIAGAIGVLALSYWDCYRRGYCGDFEHQYKTRRAGRDPRIRY